MCTGSKRHSKDSYLDRQGPSFHGSPQVERRTRRQRAQPPRPPGRRVSNNVRRGLAARRGAKVSLSWCTGRPAGSRGGFESERRRLEELAAEAAAANNRCEAAAKTDCRPCGCREAARAGCVVAGGVRALSARCAIAPQHVLRKRQTAPAKGPASLDLRRRRRKPRGSLAANCADDDGILTRGLFGIMGKSSALFVLL